MLFYGLFLPSGADVPEVSGVQNVTFCPTVAARKAVRRIVGLHSWNSVVRLPDAGGRVPRMLGNQPEDAAEHSQAKTKETKDTQ